MSCFRDYSPDTFEDLPGKWQAAIQEDANEAKLRIGTPAERFRAAAGTHGVPVDRRDVALWEQVEAALGNAMSRRR